MTFNSKYLKKNSKINVRNLIWLALFGLFLAKSEAQSHNFTQQPTSTEHQIAILEHKRRECLTKMIIEEGEYGNISTSEELNRTIPVGLPHVNLSGNIATGIKGLIGEANIYSVLRVNQSNNHYEENSDEVLFCPTEFDLLFCWPRTPANTMKTVPCPSYISGFSPKLEASRFCTHEGKWYTPEGSNTSWSNYSKCGIRMDNKAIYDLLEWTPTIRLVSRIGYSISLGALIVSVVILASFRKLRCPRNTLHMNLFASFIGRAICALCRDHSAFLEVEEDSPYTELLWCQIFTTVWQYFILANYFWILMEGVYLYILIFMALFNNDSTIRYYILIGWGAPLLLAVAWAILRINFENVLCWTINENVYVFWSCIRGPITIIILVSFVLFVRIAIEIRNKMQFFASNNGNLIYRLAKSTLVLMPLFGVHHATLIGLTYFIGNHATVELIWLLTDQFFTAHQGFFVATLYCLLNGEVRNELNKVTQNCQIFRSSKFAGNSFFHLGNSRSYASGVSNVTTAMQLSTIRSEADGLSFMESPDERQSLRNRSDSGDVTVTTAMLNSTDKQSSEKEEPLLNKNLVVPEAGDSHNLISGPE